HRSHHREPLDRPVCLRHLRFFSIVMGSVAVIIHSRAGGKAAAAVFAHAQPALLGLCFGFLGVHLLAEPIGVWWSFAARLAMRGAPRFGFCGARGCASGDARRYLSMDRLFTRITSAHLCRCVRTKSAKASGVLAIGSNICGARNFSRNCGSAKIFAASALILSTISRGVPAVANSPNQVEAS